MTITYEDIKRVNAKMKKVDIKGKDYIMVAARKEGFRELYPEGQIRVEVNDLEPIIKRNEKGEEIRRQRVVRCTAYIYANRYDHREAYLAKDHAEEIEGTSTINTGSFVENCSTSAVGRALALCGFGSAEDIASAEEVINAQGFDRITPEKAKILQDLVREVGADEKYILRFHGVKSFEEMTTVQFADAVKYCRRAKK